MKNKQQYHFLLASRFLRLYFQSIICLLAFALPMICFGQASERTPYLLTQQTLEVKFSVVVNEMNRLSVTTTTPESTLGDVNFQEPVLKDGDLKIPFALQLPKGEFNAQLSASLSHQNTTPMAQWISRSFYSLKDTIVFRDVTESGLFLGEKYMLRLKYQLFGTLDMQAPRPFLTSRKKTIPLSLIAAGVVSVGIGELIYKPEQQDAYQAYEQQWRRGDNAEAAQANFDTATDALQRRESFTYIGSAALLGGAIWWWLRSRKIHNQQEIYDRYHTTEPDISFQPVLLNVGNSPHLAFHFTYQF